MRPHPNDLDNAAILEDLVNETMMDVNAARVSSGQVTNKLLISRWSLERVDFEDFKQFFGFWFQASSNKFLCVFLSLFGENKRPFHQESSGEHFSTGVLSPRMIDSRILGIESRYNVS